MKEKKKTKIKEYSFVLSSQDHLYPEKQISAKLDLKKSSLAIYKPKKHIVKGLFVPYLLVFLLVLSEETLLFFSRRFRW